MNIGNRATKPFCYWKDRKSLMTGQKFREARSAGVFVGNILLVTGNRLRTGVASLARIEV